MRKVIAMVVCLAVPGAALAEDATPPTLDEILAAATASLAPTEAAPVDVVAQEAPKGLRARVAAWREARKADVEVLDEKIEP